MKMTLVSLAALAAFAIAPISSQASDKEVVNGRHIHACCQRHQQVAFSGHGLAKDHAAPQMQTVVQVGQGQAITFFAGYH
jgi:hypothetical protein